MGDPLFWFQKYFGIAFKSQDKIFWLYLVVANINFLRVGVIFRNKLFKTKNITKRESILFWNKNQGTSYSKIVEFPVQIQKQFEKLIFKGLWIMAILVWNKVYATKVI